MELSRFPHSGALRQRVTTNLTGFEHRRLEQRGRRLAAVAVTICCDGGEAAVVVTQRSAKLRAHSRQWALPGGRRDPGEGPVEGALRELQEEVGLEARERDVLGVLDDYATRSGYLITPVVLWTDRSCAELVANPAEVDLIRPFSFHELARRDSPILEHIVESERQVLSMHFGRDRIFAPTGAILYQFREVALFRRATRVAGFEQPVFAWR